MKISNTQFLTAIFGEQHPNAHVTSFTQDPSNIPTDQQAACWKGHFYKDKPLIPGSNQFYTVSLFSPVDNAANRRKANFIACHVIGLDDVKEKLPIEQVNKLPPPSIVLKSSMHSEQWLYMLATPETNIKRIDNLHDGLIKNGLAPNSKDPGQKGVTRYLRLPEGCNTKSKRIAENNNQPYQCNITEWHPERKYTLEQLAVPFHVDLDAPRSESRVDGADDVIDHPLLHTEAITIKSTISPGRYSVVCPWVNEHTGESDSGSAIFTNSDGSIGFKCHHGACEQRTGADLLNIIETRDVGFNKKLKTWQMFRGFNTVAPVTSHSSVNNTGSPLDNLLLSCANGQSQMLNKGMLEDKFILNDVAILGQWTVFYAEPNAGKTLLTLRMISDSVKCYVIPGDDVFYANCDDTYKGSVEKLMIAEQYKFNMLIPNVNGFKVETLLTTMKGMSEKNQAKGKVIVLDTLKKFTDLMDKKLSSDFGKIARMFITAGGTIICLAHVNKHKGVDGKSINAGTSDIRDDADCCYTIEVLNRGETKTTVEFNNSKSRGAVAQVASFEYTRNKGDSYIDVFNSVRRITKDDAELNIDSEIIEAITTGIENGHYSKLSLVNFTMETSKASRRQINRLLDKFEDRLWVSEKGGGNASLYRLINAPVIEVNFY